MTTTAKECAEVTEHLAEILDGTADERLLEHVAECDTCRDAKHDAEHARKTALEAADDYRHAADLEERLSAAIARGERKAEREPAAADEKKPAVPAATAGEKKTGVAMSLGKREAWAVRGAAALALAAGAFIVLRGEGDPASGGGSGAAWGGKVGRVVTAAGGRGLEACAPSGGACRVLTAGATLPEGSLLRTDGRTRAELTLSDGSALSIDRNTELKLHADGPRHAELVQGALVADITHAKNEARFELPRGHLTVHGTKFALRAGTGRAAVDVARGSVTLASSDRESVRVNEGETGRLEDGSAPVVGFSGGLGESLAWSDETFGEREREALPDKGLGELRAKKPGQDAERTGAVTLASHSVRVRIAGVVARTEVEEVFQNHTDEVLEGIYRFPIPADAQIERLALEVDGKLEEGAFVDRDRAAAIWRGAIVNSTPQARRPVEEIVWVPGPWKDPALLEWQRGGRFELRIFPIPKRGSRRVILAYTEIVKAAGGTRRYTYPLAYDPGGSTRVERFDMKVEVRGNDAEFGVRPSGYTLTSGKADGASTLSFAEQRFVPSGDLTLEYSLPNQKNELTAWTYAGSPTGAPTAAPGTTRDATDDGSPYVAFALRPKLPRADRNGLRHVSVVVDASRSMLGESYQRASDLAVRLARELGPDDRLSVFACSTDCRALPGGPLTPGVTAARDVRGFLSAITPEGGSDLVEAVGQALGTSVQGDTEERVLYLGDGAPTVGQVRPGSVERAVRRRLASRRASVTAVAIGADSDRATLEALARGGGGVMLPYSPGRSLSQIAYAVLGTTHGDALTDVSVRLPDGLSRVAPTRMGAIPAGGEAFVVARMNNLELSGDVILSGKVGGRAFEQRYPVKLLASDARGNAFVERLYAGARIADLELDGTDAAKKEAVGLSSRFSVASRYTSLLVLESEAMFRAFGLDNRRLATTFTGDEEAESTAADGALDVGADDEKVAQNEKPDGLGLGRLGSGPGGGGSTRASRAPADAFEGEADAPRSSAGAPAPKAAAAPSPAATVAAPAALEPMPTKKKAEERRQVIVQEDVPVIVREDRRRMIPMRRVWRRHGEVVTNRVVPKNATANAISDAELELSRNENRRESLKKLYALSLATASLERAASLSERWSAKEPLDPEAITARADVLSASGDRAGAIRVLGSVIDVRPGDVAAQKRLARLERWRGRAAAGCRYSIAIAELRGTDASLLSDAVRCARDTGDGRTAEELLANADATVRASAERLLAAAAPDLDTLKGDLRVEGTWSGGADVDLALIDPDGHRVSWLGAPTRGVISARSVTSTREEGLALSGGKPGEYVVEVVRGSGTDRASGELTITVAGTTRRVAFTLDGPRTSVAIARIEMRSELVPL